jgi:hypothetical protein
MLNRLLGRGSPIRVEFQQVTDEVHEVLIICSDSVLQSSFFGDKDMINIVFFKEDQVLLTKIV